MHHMEAPVCVEMDQDLCIGVRPKAIVFCLERTTQFAVVINLAVEDNLQRTVFAGHRLGACLAYVEQREAPMRKTNEAVTRRPQTCTVRSARGHRVANRKQLTPLDRRCVDGIADYRNESAHLQTQSCPQSYHVLLEAPAVDEF